MDNRVKIGIALAIIGGVLGLIALILIFSASANPFAFMTSNTPQSLLGIIGGSLFVLGVIIAGSAQSIVPAKTAKPKPVKEVAAKPAKEVDLSSVENLPVIRVEGIGPKYSEKLNAAGIKTMRDLMKVGRKPSGREELAQKTGISIKLILEWVIDADFSRIKGVSEEYSDLLDEADVKDVVDLAKRDPKILHQKLLETSEKKKIVRRPPSLSEVTKWIEQCKKLPKLIEY